MPPSRLSPLQDRVLRILADGPAGWALTGGGALAGFHTKHRTTRDLDLFWHGRTVLGEDRGRVTARLRSSGLDVESLEDTPTFSRLSVRDGDETLVVDLVAEPVPTADAPALLDHHGVLIHVDSPREILVNKLNALLQRVELRDLQDVRALLALGLDLAWGLEQAARKDRGFSSLTVSWVLREMPIEKLCRTEGLPETECRSLLAFRGELVQRIAAAARPTA